jgi:arginyl-tRNA synthetase
VDPSDPEASYRLALVEAFAATMKNGLYLLGIKAPEKM